MFQRHHGILKTGTSGIYVSYMESKIDAWYLFKTYVQLKNLGSIDIPVKSTEVDWGEILDKAKKRALGSGGAGATAMVVQVCSLMWMRTIMNYQVSPITGSGVYAGNP